jgi:hypothetical protein
MNTVPPYCQTSKKQFIFTGLPNTRVNRGRGLCPKRDISLIAGKRLIGIKEK